MKDDPLYDMEGGMEHMGPPIRVQNHQMIPSVRGVGVWYTVQYIQMYGPPLTAFAVTQALNNTVWERAKIENDRAQKGAN